MDPRIYSQSIKHVFRDRKDCLPLAFLIEGLTVNSFQHQPIFSFQFVDESMQIIVNQKPDDVSYH
jgi:hypothetical protein